MNKDFLSSLGLFLSYIVLIIIILFSIIFITGCGRVYESGYYKVNNKIVYCKKATKDQCGFNMFECNDMVSYYCVTNVEVLAEIMAIEMQKPKGATKTKGLGIIKYDKKGKKK